MRYLCVVAISRAAEFVVVLLEEQLVSRKSRTTMMYFFMSWDTGRASLKMMRLGLFSPLLLDAFYRNIEFNLQKLETLLDFGLLVAILTVCQLSF